VLCGAQTLVANGIGEEGVADVSENGPNSYIVRSDPGACIISIYEFSEKQPKNSTFSMQRSDSFLPLLYLGRSS
jgi:hypothetical protein